MTDKIFDNNQVVIAGEVVKDFEFSHDVFGEGFYILEVAVSRLSNSYDVIPLMISERLIDVNKVMWEDLLRCLDNLDLTTDMRRIRTN